MSLPACQQRVLDAIEKSLQASEPRLASMFAIFTRLTKGEGLADTERLPSKARWRSARRLRRLVLIPVMAAIAISGAVLGLTSRGAQACGVVYSAGRAVAVRSVASCPRPLPGKLPGSPPASRTEPKTQPAARQVAKTEPVVSSARCAPLSAVTPYAVTPYVVTLAQHEVCYR